MAAIQNIALTCHGQTISGIKVAVGSTVDFNIACLDPDSLLPIDLTGSNVLMSLCALDIAGNTIQPPFVSRQADITAPDSAGLCVARWNPHDTGNPGSVLKPGNYGADIWLTDGSGNRLQLLALISLELTPSAGLPGNAVTPLPSQDPLAQGPQGIPGLPNVVQNAGSSLPVETKLNFLSPLKATDNPGSSRTDISIRAYWFTRTIAQPADGASFTVTLPTDMVDANYLIQASMLDVSGFVLFSFPVASIAHGSFLCVTSDMLSNGDTIRFKVEHA